MYPSPRVRAAAVALVLAILSLTGCTGAGAPAPPPAAGDGLPFPGRLAYIKGGDLYLLAAGQAPVPVTKDSQSTSPAFSPDGRWLLFLRKQPSGLAELWVVPGAGGEPQPVHPGAGVPAVWTAYAWAPAGNRLAYVALDDDMRPSRLWTVDFTPAGPGQPRQAFASQVGIFGFAWAPDGTRLAVSAGSARAGAREPVRIEVVPAAGGKGQVLLPWQQVAASTRSAGAQQVAQLSGLTWSPDGQWLTFVGLPAVSSQGMDGVSLYLLHTGKATLRHLGFMLANPQWLQWNLQGDRLAVIAGSGRDATFGKKLLVFDPQRPEQPLLELTPKGEVDRDPAWAPDGSGLVVSRTPEDPAPSDPGAPPRLVAPRGGIVVTGGQAPRVLTSGKDGADVAPRFSADGRSVLFVRVHEGKSQVWLAAADGRDQKLLVAELDTAPGYQGAVYVPVVLSWTGQ